MTQTFSLELCHISCSISSFLGRRIPRQTKPNTKYTKTWNVNICEQMEHTLVFVKWSLWSEIFVLSHCALAGITNVPSIVWHSIRPDWNESQWVSKLCRSWNKKRGKNPKTFLKSLFYFIHVIDMWKMRRGRCQGHCKQRLRWINFYGVIVWFQAFLSTECVFFCHVLNLHRFSAIYHTKV